jgi:uncharacterized protein YukJ
MGRINYNCLRGKLRAFAPAAPATNPHLWVILEEGGRQWFATINIRSDKDTPGAPAGQSYLYYLIDNDFRHPIVPTILARPNGLSPVERDYASGALDFQRGNLFDPRLMRVLPTQGDAGESLVRRLQANLQIAKNVGADLFFYGNAFHKDNPHQTDAAFGYTPPTPFGLDNVHMTQGDPRAIDQRVHENGAWHDGACFIWDESARRMTGVFLAFQVQAWHTDDQGGPVLGLTGSEPPAYDFANGLGAPLAPRPRAAEITSAHRAPDRNGAIVVTNMSAAALDLSGWSILADAETDIPLPAGAIGPGQTVSVALNAGVLVDEGGILTLRDPAGLRVDGVAYNGGDAAHGWSTSFSTP